MYVGEAQQVLWILAELCDELFDNLQEQHHK